MRPLPWRAEPSAATSEADLPPGRQLLKHVVAPLAEAFEEFVERAGAGGAGQMLDSLTILSQIGSEEAAYLTARVTLDCCANGMRATATANAIANALIDHIEMATLRENKRDAFEGMIKSQRGNRMISRAKRKAIRNTINQHGALMDYPVRTRTRTGMKALHLLCDATGLFTIEQDRQAGKWVRPTETLRRWLEDQHARCELLEPIHLPMVIPPRRWSSPFKGGYLTRFVGQRLVKQSYRPYHDDLAAHDMPAVYDAVNAIQETAWRINQPVLDVLREVWDGGGDLGGLPSRTPAALPPKPLDIQTNEAARKRWKREAASIHDLNSKSLSKRLSISQRIWVAEKFIDEDEIYFPHSLDFRGRVYPIPVGGPHPQGDDIAKSLIEFAEGHPIGHNGGGDLAAHIAGLFGVDKVSYEERIDWVFANEAAILDSAIDPLDGLRFWASADSPYVALAACFEWAGYVRDGAAHITRIPVSLDGSNSGLQHFSALLRDEIGGQSVNLLPSPKPQDIYSDVARAVQEIIDASDDPRAAVWKGGRVTRRIAKRPCMTYTYSATRFGMLDMIYQSLREIDAEGARHLEGDNYEASLYLSHVMFETISDRVKAASTAMSWLRQASRVMTSAKIPIRWTTPVGLPILQHSPKVRSARIDIFHRGTRLRVTIKEASPGIDGRRQANSIAPNFIHSMDGSHLMMVANACHAAGIIDLAVVHDSFAVHANRVADLRTILRDTFADQYSVDRLAILREELRAQLPENLADKIPALPAFGNLDINAVRSSEYLFA